jgi:hypothetical protein
MIKQYNDWLRESVDYEMVDGFPVLPTNVWIDFGNKITDMIEDEGYSINLVRYLMKTERHSYILEVKDRIASYPHNYKNILEPPSFSSDNDNVIGMIVVIEEEKSKLLDAIYQFTENYANKHKFILQKDKSDLHDTNILNDFKFNTAYKHFIFLFPYDLRGAFVAKNYGI